MKLFALNTWIYHDLDGREYSSVASLKSGDFMQKEKKRKTGEPPGTVHDQNLFPEQKCNLTKQNICSSSPSLEAPCMHTSWERSGQEPST